MPLWAQTQERNVLEKIRLDAEICRLESQASRLEDNIDERIGSDMRPKWKEKLKEVNAQISDLKNQRDGLWP